MSLLLREKLLGLPRPLLLGLDVDGTLAPIVDDPAAARVPPETESLLQSLVRQDGLHVALITGRDLPALRRMITLPGAWRAVEHGRWILAPGDDPVRPPLAAEDLAKLESFATWIETTPARLERKERAVAIHTRGMPEAEERRWLEAAIAEAEGLGLHPRRGKCVVEAEVEVGDKGEALRALHERTGARSVFFAGDDLTDQPALSYATLNGISVQVARPKQAWPGIAHFTLETPAELREVLAALDPR